MSIGNRVSKQRMQDGRPKTGAVVIGSDYIALGVVRSLGRHGIPVWVLHAPLHHAASVSRFARQHLPWPEGETDRLALLFELAEQHKLTGWTLYPTDDEAAALVARNHEQLSKHYLLTTPPWEVFRWAYDKRLTHALAVRLGIGHAWTQFPRNKAELADLECEFPVILKPAVKNLTNAFTLARAWRADSRPQLLELYDEACKLVPPDVVMVQELIPGGGETQFSFAALCDCGRTVGSLVACRRRQLPIDFSRGSTYVETVEEPEIESDARRLLADMRYSGIVEVEFKRDPRNGQAKLLDINARTWGWHSLGRRAGADFPFLHWQLAHGTTVKECRARPGLRWIRMLTDIPAAFAEFRLGHLTLLAYLTSICPPVEYAMFALDDPLPALLDFPTLLWRSFRRSGRVKDDANEQR